MRIEISISLAIIMIACMAYSKAPLAALIVITLAIITFSWEMFRTRRR